MERLIRWFPVFGNYLGLPNTTQHFGNCRFHPRVKRWGGRLLSGVLTYCVDAPVPLFCGDSLAVRHASRHERTVTACGRRVLSFPCGSRSLTTLTQALFVLIKLRMKVSPALQFNESVRMTYTHLRQQQIWHASMCTILKVWFHRLYVFQIGLKHFTVVTMCTTYKVVILVDTCRWSVPSEGPVCCESGSKDCICQYWGLLAIF